jgi:hypothetical protein
MDQRPTGFCMSYLENVFNKYLQMNSYHAVSPKRKMSTPQKSRRWTGGVAQVGENLLLKN